MNTMHITGIVAMAKNRVIGKDNRLPWHLPDDLKRFKKITMGHHIIMGRNTYEGLPSGPLPGRVNIVISRTNPVVPEGVKVFSALEQALEWSYREGESEVFVIGGEQLFQAALPMTDKMLITLIDQPVEGDVFFPEWRKSEWEISETEAHPADDKHEYNFAFQTWNRTINRKWTNKPWRAFDY
jgi:dihydrofolate reductase